MPLNKSTIPSSTMSSVCLLVLSFVAVSLGVLFLLGLQLSRIRKAKENPGTSVHSMWGQLAGDSYIKLLGEEVLYLGGAFDLYHRLLYINCVVKTPAPSLECGSGAPVSAQTWQYELINPGNYQN